MDSFIVLGLIPGTDIQITFEMWIQFTIAVIAILIVLNIGLRLLRSVRPNVSGNQPDFQTVSD